ncbi:hypothetical protein QR680_007499 [Steinernema hermaphroditum]|uniref:Rho-GAP domain-containing protein n=1 Tax=Steinernema hermaphroditum TaxID=289476 RepID=A0AA39M6H5_9BILA|nr:hypothetical protein QR680_007499 [Steinernema hermaphroditum]
MIQIPQEVEDCYQLMLDLEHCENALRLTDEMEERELELIEVIRDLCEKLELTERRMMQLVDENEKLTKKMVGVEEQNKSLKMELSQGKPRLNATLPEENKKLQKKLADLRSLNESLEKELAELKTKSEESKSKNDSGVFCDDVAEIASIASFDKSQIISSTLRESIMKTPKEVLPINSKPHSFKSYAPLIDTCDVCDERIQLKGKLAVSCKDCHIRIHMHCHQQASVPCTPHRQNFKITDRTFLNAEDFCTGAGQQLQVPFPVVQCVSAIERSGLEMEGIYRIPGSVKSVKKLLNEFVSNRPYPDLNSHSAVTISGCLKKFLGSLKTAVVPAHHLSHFLKATKLNQRGCLEAAVKNLPKPSQDTLAYLCFHLQNVAEYQDANRMSIEALAVCLGPSVVCVSPHKKVTVATAESISVMLELLRLPRTFWRSILFKALPIAKFPVLEEVDSLKAVPHDKHYRNMVLGGK